MQFLKGLGLDPAETEHLVGDAVWELSGFRRGDESGDVPPIKRRRAGGGPGGDGGERRGPFRVLEGGPGG